MTIERLIQMLQALPNQKAKAMALLGDSDLMEVQNVFDFTIFNGQNEYSEACHYNMEGVGEELEAGIIRIKSETFEGV